MYLTLSYETSSTGPRNTYTGYLWKDAHLMFVFVGHVNVPAFSTGSSVTQWRNCPPLLHRDKITDVSFLGPPVLSGSPGSSLSLSVSVCRPLLCGWRRSVYGPPKTAQLNPQIEAHTPQLHLQHCSKPYWMRVRPVMHLYVCVGVGE